VPQVFDLCYVIDLCGRHQRIETRVYVARVVEVMKNARILFTFRCRITGKHKRFVALTYFPYVGKQIRLMGRTYLVVVVISPEMAERGSNCLRNFETYKFKCH